MLLPSGTGVHSVVYTTVPRTVLYRILDYGNEWATRRREEILIVGGLTIRLTASFKGGVNPPAGSDATVHPSILPLFPRSYLDPDPHGILDFVCQNECRLP